MKILARLLPFSAAAFTPVLALAQFGNVNKFFANILEFINGTLVPLIFAVAFLIFLWGVFRFFIAPEGDRDKAKDLMLWGIGGFVIMVSVWGIVNLLASGLNLTDDRIQRVPSAVPGRGGSGSTSI